MKPFLSIFVISLSLFLSGCKKDKVDDLDRFQQDLIVESVVAMEKNDHDLAITKLEQIKQFSPGDEVNRLHNYEIEMISLQRSQKALKDNNFKAANNIILEAISKIGRSEKLQDELNFIKACEAIDYYNSQKPFASSNEAFLAYQSLPKLNQFIDEGTKNDYKAWYLNEHKNFILIRNSEKALILDQLISELDYTIISNGNTSYQIFQQIKDLDSNHPVVKNWHNPPSLYKDLVDLYRDILYYHALTFMSSEEKEKTYALYLAKKPQSLSGEYIKVEAMFAKGQLNKAHNALINLQSKHSELDLSRIRPYFKGHFSDSPVKQTLSVDSILEQLYYLDSKE